MLGQAPQQFHQQHAVAAMLTQGPSAQAKLLGTAGEASESVAGGELATTASEAQLDINGQRIDLRTKTSWVLGLGEISTLEAAEVMAVNTLAPFILNGCLKPLLLSTPGNKWVVNVSAMEGKFYRYKTSKHPVLYITFNVYIHI